MAARLRPPKPGEPSQLVARLQDRYVRVLNWTSNKHPGRAALMLVALIPLTIVVMQATGFELEAFGDRGVKRNRLYIRLDFSDNVNVYKADEYVAKVEEYLLPKADSLGAEVYSFFQDNHGAVTLFFDHTVSETEVRDLRTKLRAELPVQAGVRYVMGDDDGPSRGGQSIRVRLYGEDSDLLAELATEVKRRFALIEGIEEVRTNNDTGSEEVHVVVNRQSASRFDVTPSSVASILNLTFRGIALRDLQAPDREVPMGILLRPEDRKSLENLKSMTIDLNEDGQPILLGQIADFEFHHTRSTINRQDQRTSIAITGTYEGEDSGEARQQVATTMESMSLPNGYNWSFGRDQMRAENEQSQMGLNVLLALACVYFVMAALFESLIHPLVIMSSVIFAIFGVIWFMILTNTPFNIMAMIGVVVLVGVIVNNGIVLLAHINTLRRQGLPMQQAILDGGRERFRPILMTAATTILGLLPLALGTTAMSGAMYYPMARALIGGLLSGTVLTLLVLPTLYVLAERGVERARATWQQSSWSPRQRHNLSRASGD
jgi:HAE1 family hydrophobic/amphiphilic exporter-1